METSKITKGKWGIDPQNEHSIISLDTDEMGDIICDSPNYADESMDKWVANANLIVLAGNLAQKYDPSTWEQHLADFDKMRSANQWIEITDDNMPPKGIPVIAFGKNDNGKNRTLRAMWIPKNFQEDDGDFSGDADYNEEKDAYYWPEGFYEWNEYEDTHWFVSHKITHWMPLPEPPPTNKNSDLVFGVALVFWSKKHFAINAPFKSFPIAMAMRHWRRLSNDTGKLSQAQYAASLIAGTTLMGALAVQLNEIANGRDPLDVHSKSFWARAFLKGGSAGFYGDFLQAQSTQHGTSFIGGLLGPSVGFVEESLNLSQGNLIQLMQGEDTHFGAEALKALKGITPGTSIWYLKGALAITARFSCSLSPPNS